MADLNVDQAALTTAVEAGQNTDTTPAPEATPSITELDGLSEFTFQGQKFTPDQLHKIFGEHKTFSEQSSEYKKEKEYSDNLQIDLDNVLADPKLADKFKATYPKKYHAVLDRFLSTGGQSPAQSNPAQPTLPKEFQNEFQNVKERLQMFEQRAFQAEVESANAKIEAIVPKLLEKYPMADDSTVYTRAEQVLQAGQKLTDKTWERLVRENHEQNQKRADRVYGAKMKSQIEKGQRGQDTGPGGATPGQAPKRPRTFDEAREAALESLKSQRNG
jgi:hypothetical protein